MTRIGLWRGTALASSVDGAYWSSQVWAMKTTSAGMVSMSARNPARVGWQDVTDCIQSCGAVGVLELLSPG